MIFAFFLVKARYHWTQVLGVLICIGGLGLVSRNSEAREGLSELIRFSVFFSYSSLQVISSPIKTSEPPLLLLYISVAMSNSFDLLSQPCLVPSQGRYLHGSSSPRLLSLSLDLM